MKKFLTFRNIVLSLVAIILGNLLVLNVYLIRNLGDTNDKTAVESELKEADSPYNTNLPNPEQNLCPVSCLEEINELSISLDELSQKEEVSTTVTTSSQKEYFISLGAGSSTAMDWTDVAGAEATVNGSAYGSIKQATFQVSLHTPTGNQMAYARLYNVTDKVPVWNSEVVIEGGTPKLLISQPISLNKGSKKYQVQMKTQLGSTTNLSQSRIHLQVY